MAGGVSLLVCHRVAYRPSDRTGLGLAAQLARQAERSGNRLRCWGLGVVVLTNILDTESSVPVPGEPGRFTFMCGQDLSGNVTLGWTMLYAVEVAAIILSAKFATTSIWSLGSIVIRTAMRFQRNLRQPNDRR